MSESITVTLGGNQSKSVQRIFSQQESYVVKWKNTTQQRNKIYVDVDGDRVHSQRVGATSNGEFKGDAAKTIDVSIRDQNPEVTVTIKTGIF